MKKYIRKHIKDEKRIIKLMYKKGAFELLYLELKDLYWEEEICGKRHRRRGRDKNRYRYKDYLPQLHLHTTDYWGEGNNHSIVDFYKQYFYYELNEPFDEFGDPINKIRLTNKFIINYLSKLPTKHNDSKINRLLIIKQEY